MFYSIIADSAKKHLEYLRKKELRKKETRGESKRFKMTRERTFRNLKISELIKQLQNYQKEFGDLEVIGQVNVKG